MYTRYSIEIEVGFMWFSPMRDVLKTYAWNSTDFVWEEGKGWFDRTYYIKGNLKEITELAHRFEGWCSEIRRVR